MNVTRVAVLAVALVAGGAAMFLMMGNKPVAPVEIVQPIKEETVKVLIADRDFQRGEKLAVESLKWADWPKKSVSEVYLTENSGQTPDSLKDAVARTLIVKDEPILEAKIVRSGSAGLMAAIITPGMRAVTQRVSPETASGGFILPGDRVDVMHTGGRDGSNRTRTIFENVRVLAVNALYGENPEGAYVEGVNVTLELTPEDAETFITARAAGTVSLVLRSIFQPEGEVENNGRKSSDVTVIRYGRS
jgi:pilus assembly protein CpaB